MGDKPVTDKVVMDKPDMVKVAMDKPDMDKVATNKQDTVKMVTNKPVMDKVVMDKLDTVKVAMDKPVTDKPVTDKPVMDKPDTAIKMITTMTTGVKIMGTKNNLMVDTRKRSMNTNKIDMVTTIVIKSMDTSKRGMDTNIQTTNISNHLMEGTKRNLDMDKPVMDKPNTEKPNMEKRVTIRPGPWHKTPFYKKDILKYYLFTSFIT